VTCGDHGLTINTTAIEILKSIVDTFAMKNACDTLTGMKENKSIDDNFHCKSIVDTF
jgi:hypothetical protein